jgi:general stress protein 26
MFSFRRLMPEPQQPWQVGPWGAARDGMMTNTVQAQIERVWEVMEKAGICMMTSHFSDGLRARPMEARPDPDEGAIWFLTDRRGLKDDEIEANPEVGLSFFYPKEKVYLSITGEAFVARDPERARALWNEKQQVWWPGGPEDPNLRVMRVEPQIAEMWDGPASSAVAAFEFAKARATGTKPNLGEKRKGAVDMD